MERPTEPMKRSGIKRSRRAITRAAIKRERAIESPQLRRAKKIVRKRSGGRCEVRSSVCTGTAAQAYHVKRRSQFGADEAFNLLDACAACHGYLHAHPAESYERGWLKHSWEGN